MPGEKEGHPERWESHTVNVVDLRYIHRDYCRLVHNLIKYGN